MKIWLEVEIPVFGQFQMEMYFLHALRPQLPLQVTT